MIFNCVESVVYETGEKEEYLRFSQHVTQSESEQKLWVQTELHYKSPGINTVLLVILNISLIYLDYYIISRESDRVLNQGVL